MSSATPELRRPKLLSVLIGHIPSGQLLRYLLVGIWNTASGYCIYAVFTALLESRIPHGYLVASVLANLVSITIAFLGYKWFVFKTKGNYFKEWCRCFSVYSVSMVLGLIALPGLVYFFRHNLGYQKQAPYLAGAVLTGFSVVFSFFGHKHVSFRQKPSDLPA